MKKDGLGLVQIFWGNGRGKTTSAFGTAIRACGNGYKVHIVQFMKNGAPSLKEQIPGEIKSLEEMPNITWKRFGTGEWVIDENNKSSHVKKAEEALIHVQKSLNSQNDIIVADEILYAVQLGLLKEEKVIELIKNKPRDKELILTGSHKPFSGIFELADLVTEVKKVKHPYDSGILARRGIEY